MDNRREILVTDQLRRWVEEADKHRRLWQYAIERANDCVEELQGFEACVDIPAPRPHLSLIIGGLATPDMPA